MKFMLGRFGAERDLTCQTENGLMTFSSKDGVLARRLYCRGHWDVPFVENCLSQLVNQGLVKKSGNATVVNAGSNIGAILTLLMRKGMFESGMGFEPAPKTFGYLERNVRQNGLDERVSLFQIALSDRDGEGELELSTSNSGDHRVREVADAREAYGEHKRNTIPVSLRTFDSILDERGIDPQSLDLFWVDIQGHEGRFFRGAKRALAGGAPVVCEFWPYGIERSGMGRDGYCGILEELFAGFYQLQRDGWVYRPVSKARELYDERCHELATIDVIYIRERNGAR